MLSKVIFAPFKLVPVPVSETNIPTPFSAVTSISFLFSTFPAPLANIPEDFLPVTFMFPSLSAVEVASFANIPIPSSANKLIAPLFITSEAACPNIPTDWRVPTFIVPSLIPFAFSLASIPIFLLSVAVVDSKLITPPVLFVATTSSFVAPDLFVTIIPTDSLFLISIFPLFSNFKLEFAPVVLSIRPSIAADFVPLIIIFPIFSPATFLFPAGSSNFTEIPADSSAIAVIVPLLITVPILEFE